MCGMAKIRASQLYAKTLFRACIARRWKLWHIFTEGLR